MKKLRAVVVLHLSVFFQLSFTAPLAKSPVLSPRPIVPLVFEKNQGQTDRGVKFLSRGPEYTLLLTQDLISVRFSGTDSALVDPYTGGRPDSPSIGMRFVGSRKAEITGVDPLPGLSHYFRGNEPAGWNRNIGQFGKVRYGNLYPGIDAVFHAERQQLEYDLRVAPGADPGTVLLELERTAWSSDTTGRDRTSDWYWSASIDSEGALLLRHGAREMRQLAPVLYQQHGGRTIPVSGRYVARATPDAKSGKAIRVGFQVDAYDTALPLVIDPQIVFSVTVQANGPMSPSAYYVDAAGNAYVGGATLATDLPSSSGLQPGPGGGFDAYVVKISPQGRILFSVYLGGTGEDRANGITVDAGGNLYLTGNTASSNFPTRNPIHDYRGNGDAFVTKLTPSGGAITYSTFLGGAQFDFANGIAVDAGGNAYVTGSTSSTNFPLQGAFQSTNRGNQDLFIAKLNSAGSALVYSSYLGGTQFESNPSIGVDASGNAYIAATTQSTDFPMASPFQNRNRGDQEAVVCKVNAAGSALAYSTYLGGDDSDRATGIAVDPTGNAFVVGLTTSRNFPTQNPFQPALAGGQDVFISKISPSGSALVYSSYLGGTGADTGAVIAIDRFGRAFIGGGPSADFPMKNPIQTSGPTFLAQVSPSGAELEFSSFIGGSDTISIAFGIGLVPAGAAKMMDPGGRDVFIDEVIDLFTLFRNNSLPQVYQIDSNDIAAVAATEEFADNCIRIIDNTQGIETNGAVARPVGGKLGWRVTTSNIGGRLFAKIQEAVDFVGADQAGHKLDFRSGDTVQLGECNFTETAVLRKTHSTTGALEKIALAGSGKKTQIISPGGVDPVIDVLAEAAVLTSFAMDGGSRQETLVQFREGNAGSVTNVDFNKAARGVYATGRKDLTLSACKFDQVGFPHPAIEVDGSTTQVKISDNTSIQSALNGIKATGSIVLIDGVSMDGSETAIGIDKSDKVTIRKLKISNHITGLLIENSKQIVVETTEITSSRSNNLGTGIRIGSSEGFTVGPKVRLEGNVGVGLAVTNCTAGKNAVSGSDGRNQFNNNGQGIVVVNSRVDLVRNTITGNKDVGLKRDRSSTVLSVSTNAFFKNGKGVADDAPPANKAETGSTGDRLGTFAPDKFENNLVVGNTDGGLVFTSDGNEDLGGGSAGSSGGNLIAQNGGFDLVNNTGLRISARNNLWDNAEPSQVLSQDVSAGAGVDVAPILTAQSIRFAQFVEAPGFTSTLTLIDPSRTNAVASLVAFRNSSGAGADLILNDVASARGLNGTAVSPLGAERFSTNPSNSAVNVGSITVASGRPLAGTVVFSSAAGVAGVGRSELLTQFVAPVERSRSRSINSGLAVMNPNAAAPVNLQLRLKEAANGAVRNATLVLPAGGQAAKFIDELFEELAAEFSGTLSVSAAANIAATVIRTSPGQFATLPVTGAGSRNLLFAQFGEAAGISSTMTFVNPSTDRAASVTVRLFDDNGSPLTVNLGGADRAGQFTFSVPPESASSFASPGTSTLARIGSVVVDSTENIGGTILFGGSFGLAGVGNSQGLSNFVAPVEQISQLGVTLGIALMNTGTSQVTVRLTLRNEAGVPLSGGGVNVVIPSRGHVAKFLSQFFPGLDLADFAGTITGETTGQIGATVIRQSAVPVELATLPVTEIIP